MHGKEKKTDKQIHTMAVSLKGVKHVLYNLYSTYNI